MIASDRAPAPTIGALTGARFVAACFVVLFHFHRHAIDDHQRPLFRALSTGFLSVGFFFVLSGFILAHTYAARALHTSSARRDFWQNRVARVYPLYATTMALGVVSAVRSRWTTLAELRSSLGLQRLAAVTLVFPMLWEKAVFVFNWAAWSLLSEAVFYLCFPWIFTALNRRSTKHALAIASALFVATMTALALYQYYDLDHLERALRLGDERTRFGHWIRFSPLAHGHEFVIGVVAAIVTARNRERFCSLRPLHRDMIVATLACASVLGAALALDVGYVFMHSGALAPVFAVIIAALSLDGGGRIARALASPLAQRLGRASYAMYLLHVPLWFLLQPVTRLWRDAAALTLYSALLLLGSWILHIVVEEPARRWLRAR